ncbi:hypothetical protein VP01_1952g2 [Puccinia sorghi]|uniref:Uncharacterized protein n=1 Tax=Puccinia sorghi TaxID=27349 RepID=A0A0L6VC55_9BASI|nr:hypothetical protein VP01_1952g2 [Puccinia sorghi]
MGIFMEDPQEVPGNQQFLQRGQFPTQLPKTACQAKDPQIGPEKLPQPRPKFKAPLLWGKDGQGGLSSICIILDWLAVNGNYQNWQDYLTMFDALITHIFRQRFKNFKPPTQRQENSKETLNWVSWMTTSQMEVVIFQVRLLPSPLKQSSFSIFKYWDDLDHIMGAQKVTNTSVTTTDST